MTNKNTRVVFITWTLFNPHSSLLNEAFNGKIFYVNNLIKSRGVMWKLFFLFDYIYKSFKTIVIILKNHPDLVVIQNPPSIVPLVIILFSHIKKYKTVVDSHNGAFEKPWTWIPFYKWSLKKADIVITHNNQIYERLKSDNGYRGINFKVLNSRLSEFKGVKKEIILSNPYMLVVSTFSDDEPIENILKGVMVYLNRNEENVTFIFTGNYNKKPALYDQYKNEKNIVFSGFVSNEQYKNLMINSYGVISLSTRDDVQQFALMETIGAGVPFISNDNRTNKALFGDKMILIKITPENIAEGIEQFINNKGQLTKNVLELQKEILAKWEKDFNLIKAELRI